MTRRHGLLAAAMAGLLLLAACGDDGGDPSVNAQGTETSDDGGDGSSTTAAPADDDPYGDDAAGGDGDADAAGSTVAIGETDLGDVLVDADGMTLYLFTNDTAEASACTDGCDDAWPPLVADGDPTAGDGVDASKLGTIEREDGTMQVTYNGHPLYTYAADSEPGDTAGQGVGDVWWAVGADGEPISS